MYTYRLDNDYLKISIFPLPSTANCNTYISRANYCYVMDNTLYAVCSGAHAYHVPPTHHSEPGPSAGHRKRVVNIQP